MSEVKYEMDWKALFLDMEFDKILAVMRGMAMTMKIVINRDTGESISKVPDTIHEIIESLVMFIDESLPAINKIPAVESRSQWIIFENHPFILAVNPYLISFNAKVYFAPIGICGNLNVEIEE